MDELLLFAWAMGFCGPNYRPFVVPMRSGLHFSLDNLDDIVYITYMVLSVKLPRKTVNTPDFWGDMA